MYATKEYYENRIAELEAKVAELQEIIAQNMTTTGTNE